MVASLATSRFVFQSPQRRSSTGHASSVQSHPEGYRPGTPQFPHVEQLAAHVEDAIAHAHEWQAQAELQQISAQHVNNSSELERRIKALENLVHRLVQDKAIQSVGRRVPSQFSNVPAEESLPERSLTAANDPFAALTSVPQATNRARVIAERTTRQARQDTRLARMDALRGLEKLKQEQAKLDAERQQLTEKLQLLDRRAHSLHLKMAQEMAEIESSQTQGNAP